MTAMRKLSPLVILVLALAAGACEPEKPAMPSFAVDVGPILASHCVRCHGAGGTLQGEPGDPLGAPTVCHFNIYDDVGDCNADPTTCQTGAKTCSAIFEAYLPSMPPPPAAKLNAWELDVLRTWAKNPTP
jgi:hypothetical protein